MPIFTFIMQDDGKLPIGMKETLARVFPSFAGKKVRVSVSEAKEKRSLDQNALYWVAYVPHVRQVRFDMGDPVTIDETHEDLLAEYAPRVESKTLHRKGYTRPMRSKEMSVPEMTDYMTAISAAMATMGHPIKMREEYAA